MVHACSLRTPKNYCSLSEIMGQRKTKSQFTPYWPRQCYLFLNKLQRKYKYLFLLDQTPFNLENTIVVAISNYLQWHPTVRNITENFNYGVYIYRPASLGIYILIGINNMTSTTFRRSSGIYILTLVTSHLKLNGSVTENLCSRFGIFPTLWWKKRG